MDWSKFVAKLAKLGYQGASDDFVAVQKWLRDNKHDAERATTSDGEVVELKELFDRRPGKPLDVTDVRDEAAFDRRVKEAAKAEVEALAAAAGLNRNGERTKAVTHDITVKERIEDDPCLGYRPFKEQGWGQYLFDVYKQAQATQEGRPSAGPQRLTKATAVLSERQKSLGLNEQNDADGGFLVAPEHKTELLRKMHETGIVYTRARNVPMNSRQARIPTINETSRADGSRQGGVRAFWQGEGQTYITSKPSFGMITLEARKLCALGYVTEELDEDSSLPQLQLMGELFAEELSFALDVGFIRGIGGSQPLGILNSPAAIAYTRSGATGDFEGQDAVGMLTRFYARSWKNGVWFVHQSVMDDVIRMAVQPPDLTTSSSVHLISNLQSSPSGLGILGMPVIICEQCSYGGTAGDVILADMTQYLYGNRRGITTEQSIHVQFVTGETAFKASVRADGQPWWNSTLAHYSNTAATAATSPFIVLT